MLVDVRYSLLKFTFRLEIGEISHIFFSHVTLLTHVGAPEPMSASARFRVNENTGHRNPDPRPYCHPQQPPSAHAFTV